MILWLVAHFLSNLMPKCLIAFFVHRSFFSRGDRDRIFSGSILTTHAFLIPLSWTQHFSKLSLNFSLGVPKKSSEPLKSRESLNFVQVRHRPMVVRPLVG